MSEDGEDGPDNGNHWRNPPGAKTLPPLQLNRNGRGLPLVCCQGLCGMQQDRRRGRCCESLKQRTDTGDASDVVTIVSR